MAFCYTIGVYYHYYGGLYKILRLVGSYDRKAADVSLNLPIEYKEFTNLLHLHTHKWLSEFEQIPLPIELTSNREDHGERGSHVHPRVSSLFFFES